MDEICTLALGRIADGCVIDLVDENGLIRQAAASYVDFGAGGVPRQIAPRAPDLDLDMGPLHTIRTHRREVFPSLDETRWSGEPVGARHPRAFRDLGVRSYVCVPLFARGRVLGAIRTATEVLKLATRTPRAWSERPRCSIGSRSRWHG